MGEKFSTPTLLKAGTALTMAMLALTPQAVLAQTAGPVAPSEAPSSQPASPSAPVSQAATPATPPEGASAQVANPASNDQDGLKDIVVTATRVQTNAQKTPVAVDVFGGADLLSQGVRDVTSLGNIAPGVNITGNSGGSVIIAIRGISSRDTTEVGDPAVTISTDGFYVDRPYAISLAQYDLDRIEVLKGPQGTLYGRNATGGAINIITTKPKNTFGGYVTGEVGNYDALNVEGALNVPLTSWLQARASFSSQYHAGYRDAGVNGRFDDQNARSGRFQLQATPADDLTLHFLVQRTTQNSNPALSRVVPYAVDANGYVIHQIPPLGSSTDIPAAAPGHLNLQDTVLRWDVAYSTPFANFLYLGGYDNLHYDQLAPAFNFTKPNQPLSTARLTRYNQTENPRTQNHEFRVFSANQDLPITFQAGVFYFKEENHLDSRNHLYPADTNIISFLYDIEFKSFSEFGQLSYKLLDNLKFTGGVRHNHDEKTRAGQNFIGSGPLAEGAAIIAPGGGSIVADKWTYHAGVDWQVTPRNLLYAKFDTGYKAAGFTDLAPYGPEDVQTFEAGSKNRFFDNKIQFNIDGYTTTYTGQQVNTIVVLDPATGATGQKTVNAGKSKIWGIEAQLTAALPLGRVDLSVDYLHARFTDFSIAAQTTRYVNGAYTSPVLNYNLAGNRPPNSPTFTIAGGYEKSFDALKGTFTPRVQFRYVTAQNFTFYNYDSDRQKPYTITNLTLNYRPADTGWDVELFLRNAFNVVAFSGAGENDRGFDYAYSYVAPRTFGGRVSFRF